MADDATSLNRYGQPLIVEVKRAHGSPPDFAPDWSPIWSAKVDRVEINRDGRPSTATIWFPDLRWDQTRSLLCGDAVRIRTNHRAESKRTVLLSGFVTAYLSDFSGGSEKPKTAFAGCWRPRPPSSARMPVAPTTTMITALTPRPPLTIVPRTFPARGPSSTAMAGPTATRSF